MLLEMKRLQSARAIGRILARMLASMTLLALLAGCGFHPIKAEQSSGDSPVADKLAAIKIDLINNRIGQELRNNLLDRMNPRGEPVQPAYQLTVKLHEAVFDVGVSRENIASQTDLNMSGTFTLKNASGETLIEQNFGAINSYAIDPNAYATLVSHQDAEVRLLHEIADEIALKISLYMRREAQGEQ
jgi:LPS-assembly lipoprotein